MWTKFKAVVVVLEKGIVLSERSIPSVNARDVFLVRIIVSSEVKISRSVCL